jgi:hypothetical protein
MLKWCEEIDYFEIRKRNRYFVERAGEVEDKWWEFEEEFRIGEGKISYAMVD